MFYRDTRGAEAPLCATQRILKKKEEPEMGPLDALIAIGASQLVISPLAS